MNGGSRTVTKTLSVDLSSLAIWPFGALALCPQNLPSPVPAQVPSAAPPRRIKPLPDLVANQIAAGEVVERPASVVKELVENAIDAGANRVVVDLEQGGIELVRITDDGCGIPSEDLPLAVAAHATSKIENVADLDHIATLGFRGEALASIAAVSRLSLRSRTKADTGASLLEVEGDRLGPIKPAAGPVGTVITVRNLFFNTPARRKFLRTVPTEQTRCMDVLRDLATAHPAIGFTATADGRTLLDLPPGQSARERAIAILGEDLTTELLDISADSFDDSRGVALWGLIGRPSIAKGNNKSQHLFINGRAIRDKTIQHAIGEAYRGLIEPGRYPTCIVMLEMSPAGVDVNVHPQKAEVRFRDSGLIHSVVLRAVRDALRAADLTPSVSGGVGARFTLKTDGQLPGATPTLSFASSPATEASPRDTRPDPQQFVDFFRRVTSARPQGTLSESGISRESPSALAGNGTNRTHGTHGSDGGSTTNAAPLKNATASSETTPLPTSAIEASPFPTPESPLAPLNRLLQIHKSFLVTQDEQGVVIIDQHALHERVMFEYLYARVFHPLPEGGGRGKGSSPKPLPEGGVGVGSAFDEQSRGQITEQLNPDSLGRLESQPLLIPTTIPAAPAHLDKLEDLRPLLARIGIEAHALGPTTIAVTSFPTFLFERRVDPVEFMLELLEKSESTDFTPTSEEALREVLDMMACKAAVKAGDQLSELELGELVKLREQVDRSSNCPHGRPTSIRLTIKELERLFGRT
jgi:DNA mismatch repair protein MutL